MTKGIDVKPDIIVVLALEIGVIIRACTLGSQIHQRSSMGLGIQILSSFAQNRSGLSTNLIKINLLSDMWNRRRQISRSNPILSHDVLHLGVTRIESGERASFSSHCQISLKGIERHI